MREVFSAKRGASEDEESQKTKVHVIAFLTTIFIISVVIVTTVAILPAYKPSEDVDISTFNSSVNVTADLAPSTNVTTTD